MPLAFEVVVLGGRLPSAYTSRPILDRSLILDGSVEHRGRFSESGVAFGGNVVDGRRRLDKLLATPCQAPKIIRSWLSTPASRTADTRQAESRDCDSMDLARIDLSGIDEHRTRLTEARELATLSRTAGWAVLTNHGISQTNIESMVDVVGGLCDVPADEQKYWLVERTEHLPMSPTLHPE